MRDSFQDDLQQEEYAIGAYEENAAPHRLLVSRFVVLISPLLYVDFLSLTEASHSLSVFFLSDEAVWRNLLLQRLE